MMIMDFLFKLFARGFRARRSTSSGRVVYFCDFEFDFEFVCLGVVFLVEDDDFLVDFFLLLLIFGIGNVLLYNLYASASAYVCVVMSFVG